MVLYHIQRIFEKVNSEVNLTQQCSAVFFFGIIMIFSVPAVYFDTRLRLLLKLWYTAVIETYYDAAGNNSEPGKHPDRTKNIMVSPEKNITLLFTLFTETLVMPKSEIMNFLGNSDFSGKEAKWHKNLKYIFYTFLVQIWCFDHEYCLGF